MNNKEELKAELKLFIIQFIRGLNPDARSYFIEELERIVDKWYKTEES